MADQPLPDHNRLAQYILQPVMVPRDPVWQEVLAAGHGVIECVFPSRAEARLSVARRDRNSAVLRALRAANVEDLPLCQQLVTGSRAEGLALENNWGHEPTDCDTMFIYSDSWAVRMPPGNDVTCTPETEPSSYLEMISDGCPPCFCQVQIRGSVSNMVDNLKQSMERCVQNLLDIWTGVAMAMTGWGYFFLPHCHIIIKLYRLLVGNREEVAHFSAHGFRSRLPGMVNGLISGASDNNIDSVYIRKDDGIYLSSREVLRLLKVRGLRGDYQGPSQQVTNMDLVPSLVVSRPFPCIQRYLARRRTPEWPSPEALEDIRTMLAIIVPTGFAGSPVDERPFQWRFSFSPQELRLSHDMPAWVKSGYRAFKYTVKAALEQAKSNHPAQRAPNTGSGSTDEEARDSSKSLCSFHMKTMLLWTLEDAVAWEKSCCFRLMILLLRNLWVSLRTATLPHYFNPACNLLELLTEDNLEVARCSVASVLHNPARAMCHSPSSQRQQRGLLLLVYENAVWRNERRETLARFETALADAGL